jgi:hypothetical protein
MSSPQSVEGAMLIAADQFQLLRLVLVFALV